MADPSPADSRDAEILDLTICCSAFLGLGRTLHALGIAHPTREAPLAERADHPEDTSAHSPYLNPIRYQLPRRPR